MFQGTERGLIDLGCWRHVLAHVSFLFSFPLLSTNSFHGFVGASIGVALEEPRDARMVASKHAGCDCACCALGSATLLPRVVMETRLRWTLQRERTSPWLQGS